jgi:hypothetical protein
MKYYLLRFTDSSGNQFYFTRHSGAWGFNGVGDGSFGLLTDPEVVEMQARLTEKQMKLGVAAYRRKYNFGTNALAVLEIDVVRTEKVLRSV